MRKSCIRQVLGEEARAARHVRAREFSAIARGFILADPAQVTHVVEERDDEASHGALAAEAFFSCSLPLVTDDEPRECESDVQRVLAIVINGVDAEIARDFAREQALEAARHDGTLSWQLRAATSLARLLRDRDRIGEARDLLAPIYERFTEGFGTTDLQAAKLLLDELT